MASDVGTVAGYLGTATAIVTINQVSKSKDPIPSIVTGGIFFGLLILLGTLTGPNGYRFIKLFAAVILFAVVIGQGYPLLKSISKLTTGVTTPVRTK